jgi:7-cyano-7-deazaguanine synthase
MEKIGILFSGGLESTSLISFYKRQNWEIVPIYIKYGFKWESTELVYAEKIANYFDVSLVILDRKIKNIQDLGFVNNVKSNIILMRNLTLIIDGSYYLINNNVFHLALGLFGDKNYPDTSLDYISNIEKLISIGINKKFNIFLPFYGLNKEIIFEKFKNDIPLDLIFSCTNPINGKRCHKCYKCKQLDKLIKHSIKKSRGK